MAARGRSRSLFVLLVFGVILSCGCQSRRPQPSFENALKLFRQDQLLPAQEEAERGVRAYETSDPVLSWRFRLLLAELLNTRGLSKETITLLMPGIPANIRQDDLEIRRRTELAIAYSRTGDSASAAEHLEWAEKKSEATRSVLLGYVLMARGVVQVDQEQLPSAEISFRKSLELARQQRDRFLQAANLINLGVAAIRQGRYDASTDWSRQAERVAREIGAPVTELKALGNLGWAYYKLGDYERSFVLFDRAISRANDLDAVLDQVTYSAAAGVSYYRTGRIEEAERSFRRSLELAQRLQNRSKTIDGLTMVSLVLARKGDYEEGRTMCDRALEMARSDGLRLVELDALLVRGMNVAGAGSLDEAESTFRQIAEDPRADLSLQWQARQNLAKLYEVQRRDADAERSYRKALTIYQTARASLMRDDSRLPFLANAERIYDDYIRFLIEHNRPVEALKIVDEARATTLAEGLGLKNGKAAGNVDPQRVAASANAAVLYYWLGEERSYVWAITQDKVKLSVLPRRDELARLVQDHTKALVNGRDVLRVGGDAGLRLYETLVAPAKELIRPDSRVIVIADGVLHSINFETLLVPEPKLHYWIEDVTIANASSLRLLTLRRKPTPRSARRMLLMGDPVVASADYPELAKAAMELEMIGRHFDRGNRELRTRENATPNSYMQSHPERFTYIHFVAHGISSRLSPLDSAVVLSKATKDDDSFKLYARQVVELPINAELVTVSTCYGAGTRAYSGEGLVGLTWAFLRAGARNAIGALWAVSDAATPQLMDDFYAGLQKGQAPETALRQAKLKQLHSPGVFRKPFYWAPFQLYSAS